MKVKILSMHRVVNYGSFMQAYALKQVVEGMGHEVSFCDFKPGEPRHYGAKIDKGSFAEKLARLPYILKSPFQYIKKKAFRNNLRKTYQTKAWGFLDISPNMDYNYDVDVLLIGSDEVFNYTQNHVFGYVPIFFGHGSNAKSIISYAASAGYATPKDVESDNMQDELIRGFSNFDFISVRDQNTYDLVSQYSSKAPALVIDPTLLYDFQNEVPGPVIPSNYLLVYAYDGRLDEPEDVIQIRNFANQHGLRIVSVGFYHEWCDENLVVSPFEILSVFKHATYVITDTFHGTIFSIKNKKPFVSLIRGENRWGSNSNKLGFLLGQLGLQDRINSDLVTLSQHLNTTIDYAAVYNTISELREASLAFLVNALNHAQNKLNENN